MPPFPPSQAICALASTTSDCELLVASRDNTLTFWDMRAMGSTRVLRAPGFTVCVGGDRGGGRQVRGEC